ncbi:DNA-J related domain-containing protein [Catenovulum adriaticum]|uniref:DnaJ domain-containing protein n=1 Tax=Catenovulum adriaticum TaxID=2984846 RepID=A0ABY7ANV6_9ALTE|nr:DNA-J related domain-containing protein [Catenovulum sp. TS8]WAJ71240.1 DnaJ domain-containing protein [Catenovulum sp. TS8]
MDDILNQAKNVSKQLQLALTEILALNAQPIKVESVYLESDLIKQLQQSPYQLLPEYQLDDSFALFQIHFILYHSLYQLKLKCSQNQTAYLKLGLASISVQPWLNNQQNLTTQILANKDNLQDYYLDLSNLIATQAQDVESMLDNFWRQIQKPLASQVEIEQAQALLNVSSSTSMLNIKAAYKAKCLQHHPDRGGSKTDLQQINKAYQVLKNQLNEH